MNLWRVAAPLGLALVVCNVARASGERANIRGVGMARTFVATSRGLDAVGTNPANLALNDGSAFSVSLPALGAHIGSDIFDYDLYTRYFSGVDTDSGRVGRHLAEDDKRDILSRFHDHVGSTIGDLDARLFGLTLQFESIGAIAFTVTEHIGASAKLPEDYVRFILYGNPAGTTYDFSATDAKASWTREYALTFASAVPGLPGFQWCAVGATVKMVHGFAYFELERFNTSLATADNGVLSGYVGMLARASSAELFTGGGGFSVFPDPAGRGLGLDVGFAGGINQFLSCGLSITDIGTVRWSKSTQEVSVDTAIFVDDPLDPVQRDVVNQLVSGKKKEAGEFSSSLPTMVRAGFALEVHKIPTFRGMPGELVLGFDYNQGLREAATSCLQPRFSLGMEYKPLQWLPIRCGISFGGTDHVNYAMGLGFRIGFFDLDLASENINWIFSQKSSSYGSIAMGMTLKF